MRTITTVSLSLLMACTAPGKAWLHDAQRTEVDLAQPLPTSTPERVRDLERTLGSLMRESEYVSERKVTAASFDMKFGPLTVLRCPVEEAKPEFGEKTGEAPGIMLQLRSPNGAEFGMLLVSQEGEWRLDPSYPLTRPVRFQAPEIHSIPAPLLAALEEGVPDETFKSRIGGFWLVKLDGKPHAISTVCPKMGGAPNCLWDSHTYKCPICGSTFEWNGERKSGPAPTDLTRVAVTVDASGLGTVDLRRK